MTPRHYSNIAVATTLSAGIGVGDASCAVVSATGYPTAPFAIVVDGGTATEEVMLVTVVAGLTFTITRGYDGTTAAAHSAGATVIHAAIADDLRGTQLGTRDMATTAPNASDVVTWSGMTWAPAALPSSAPSGPAGGVLSGTYPNPGFAVDMATQAELDAALPARATIWFDEATGNVTLSATTDSVQKYNIQVYQSGVPANGDYIEITFPIKAGSYTLFLLGMTEPDAGIINWSIDGVLVATFDGYTAGIVHNVVFTVAIVIAQSGMHTLRGTISGKNAGSSGFYYIVTKGWIR